MSTRIIEEEAGTFVCSGLRHEGYWAGDFTGPSRPDALEPWFRWGVGQSGSARLGGA
jgi:hypothetical protein